MRTSESECIESLREAAERLEQSPTKAEYDELHLSPSSTTIKRVFGSWNDAKEAAGLEPFDQGENGGTEIQPKPEWVETPDNTAWETLTAQQRWYYKNRRHRIAIKEQRRRGLHRWLYELKRDELACTQCREARPPALDFHHPDSKEQSISEMVNDGHSKATIREEIERCRVLCANCHRREHDQGPAPESLPSRTDIEETLETVSGHDAREKRRTWVLAYKHEQPGCRQCHVTDPVCLEFHHSEQKTESIGRMITHGHQLSDIQAEMQHCELLCANCHRETHFEPPSSEHYDTHK